jgi:hypothetical protein
VGRFPSCAAYKFLNLRDDGEGDRVRATEWGGGVCGRLVRLGHEHKAVCIVSEGYRDGKS